MAVHAPIRFISKDKSQFYQTLSARVDAYFQKNRVSKYASKGVILKTVVLLTAYLLPFFLVSFLQPAFGWALVWCMAVP